MSWAPTKACDVVAAEIPAAIPSEIAGALSIFRQVVARLKRDLVLGPAISHSRAFAAESTFPRDNFGHGIAFRSASCVGLSL